LAIAPLTGVLCAGNISHDILVRPVDRFEWGTNTWVDEYVEDMGGNGSNTSYVLAKLGVPVRLLGMTGPDTRGNELRAKLADAGVDIAFIGTSQQPTTTTICVVNSQADRLFFQRVGSSNEAFTEPTVFAGKILDGISHYHQANLYSLPNLRRNSAAQMRGAREAGLTTSLDTGCATDGRWIEVLAPALPYTDLLFVNREEARMLTGSDDPPAIASRLRDHGATDIIVKLGAQGCVLFIGSECAMAPGFPVEVVDTTGAGDNFAAGFFAALYHGVEYREAARIANAVGALSVTKLGAVSAAGSWEQLLEWISGRE
jgi:sugar/nucleoside kinase (ribokinase family)